MRKYVYQYMDMQKMHKKNLDFILKNVSNKGISTIESILSELIQISSNCDFKMESFLNVVKKDPPTTARILNFANSTFYATNKRIDDIERAVIYLGYGVIINVVATAFVCDLFKKECNIADYKRKDLWKSSVSCALCNDWIYKVEFQKKNSNAYLAGLLANIGIILEDQYLHDSFVKIIKMKQKNNSYLNQEEKKTIGITHEEIGAYILKKWNLSPLIISAVENHHTLNCSNDEDEKLLVYTTNLSHELINKYGYRDTPDIKKTKSQKYLKISDIGIEAIKNELDQKIIELEKNGLF